MNKCQLHEPIFSYNPDLVRCVKIIAFNDQDQILAVRHGHKYGILCGNVEWDDEDTEDAARREVIEAANITLGPLALSTIIESKNSNDKPEYTLVYSGRVAVQEPLLPKQKRIHRFLKKNSLLKNAEKPILHEIINRAEFFLRDCKQIHMDESYVAS